jgi:hypothetical protein
VKASLEVIVVPVSDVGRADTSGVPDGNVLTLQERR